MTQDRPFDRKNAEDYEEITHNIQAALEKLRSDKTLAATRVNLAQLSGVHRNTLYNRAACSAPDGNVDNGWPLRELAAIKKARKFQPLAEPVELAGMSVEQTAARLSARLEKSRYEAGRWFHRSVELKRQRDEARRQIELLVKESDRYKREIEDLRKQVLGQIRVVPK